MSPPELVEHLIQGFESFRLEHCNPDRPRGWIESERAYSDAYHAAAARRNESYDALPALPLNAEPEAERHQPAAGAKAVHEWDK